MKIFTKKKFIQKIVIVIIIIMSFSAIMPTQSQAGFGGKLFEPIFNLLAALADVPIGLLQHTMLGAEDMVFSVMLDDDDSYNVKKGIWHSDKTEYEKAKYKRKLEYGEKDGNTRGNASEKYDGYISDDGIGLGPLNTNKHADIPNMLYCPENIFSNKIAMFDVDFINPSTYTDAHGRSTESVASKLTVIVANWYKAFRNVAIVGLLSILVYIGIRILIGSTAQDKAKYKERLRDWIIGLCLLFLMHFIMAGMMMITDIITKSLSESIEPIHVSVDNYDPGFANGLFNSSSTFYFKTNFMGYIRFMVQSASAGDAFAYLIMYIALVIFTIMFTITYLKRVLYMAFFTIIAPLVAMTYPLDKLADGQAQGFNTWFREYMMNALIQPVHLILYTILMTTVMDLVIDNPVYGIVALAFLIPAEKFIKKMFRFDKGETTSTLGAVAGGALAMKGLKSATGLSKKISSGQGGENNKIRTNDNTGDLGKRGKNPNISKPETVLANEHEANLLEGGSTEGDSLSNRQRISLQGIDAPEGWGTPMLSNGEPDRSRIIHSNIDNGDENNSNIIKGNNQWKLSNDTAELMDAGNLKDSNVQLRKPTGQSVSSNAEENNNSRLKIVAHPVDDKLKERGTASRIARATGNYMKRGAKRTAIKGVKTLGRGLKATPRFALKTAARGVGAITLGTIAAGAAVTSGDLSKGASMVGAGALIGSGLGGAVGGKVSDKIGNTSSNLKDVIRDSYYTAEEKKKEELIQMRKFDEKWKKDENNIKYLREKGLNDERAKAFLNDSNTQRFLEADVTDINMIYNARKMSDDSNGKINIDGAVARARLAKNASDGFKTNYSEQNSFKENMKSKNAKLKDEDLNKLVEDIIKIKDRH